MLSQFTISVNKKRYEKARASLLKLSKPTHIMKGKIRELKNAVAYLERIFETIDGKPLVDNLPGAVEMPSIQDAEPRNSNLQAGASFLPRTFTFLTISYKI